eukprot:1153865-Pelagomonas_calceolata.AAC.2
MHFHGAFAVYLAVSCSNRIAFEMKRPDSLHKQQKQPELARGPYRKLTPLETKTANIAILCRQLMVQQMWQTWRMFK